MRNRAFATLLGAMVGTLVLGFLPQRLTADEARSASEVKSFSRRIDALIDKRMRAAGIKPAPPAGDAQFLRRVSLDVTGRIPNLLDVRDFLDPTNDETDKRWTWAERMFKTPEYADHFTNVWRAKFIPTISDKLRRWNLPSFEDWMRKHLQKNTPYDLIVRDLLTALPDSDSDAWNARRAYFYANGDSADHGAAAAARVFLGAQLECAQCHDHTKWTRRQFWEFAAFFGVEPLTDKNKIGRQITIPGTSTVVKAKFPTAQEPLWKDKDDSRKIIADWITAKDNPFFAKATVDLIWRYFFDVSLLQPNGGESITHPELLEELAGQFVSHGFDLKFLIRAIVHTQAYQRSSDVPGNSSPDDLALFARMPIRALSPEQVFDSFAEATDYKQVIKYRGSGPTPRDLFLGSFRSEDQSNERPASTLRALLKTKGSFFAKRTELDVTMTSERTAYLSDLDRQKINVSLHTIALHPAKHKQPLAKLLETLYLLALSRPPRPDEIERDTRYVRDGTRDRRHAFADIYHALLSSDEFAQNH